MKLSNTHYDIKTSGRKFLAIIFIAMGVSSFSQNVIMNENNTGTSTNPGTTILDLSFSHLGFLLPNMTDAQMKAISAPATSLMVFNTTLQCYEIYSGSAWQPMWCLCDNPPSPTPTISGTTSVCPGSIQTYSVSNSSLINATSYTWTPASSTLGTITSGQGTGTITVTMGTVSGTFSVTATNACGTSITGTLAITMAGSLPTVAPSYNSPVCTGNTIDLFVNATGGPTSYSWTGPNAFTSTLANPTITPAIAANGGTYSVTATNSCGTSTVGTIAVVVNTTPTVTPTASPSAICAGSSSTISVTGASTYTWTPNTNLSATTGASVTANPPSTTTYSVTGTSASGCVSSSTTVILTVNPLPATPVIGTNYKDPCGGTQMAVGQIVTYTVSPVAGETFAWSTTGGTVAGSPGTSVNITWTSSGTHTINCVATVTATGCSSSTATYSQTVTATATCSYTTCSSGTTFVVPTGITTLTVTAAGASGGISDNGAIGPPPGTNGNCEGALIKGTYNTSGGTVLYLNIGCVGGNATTSAAGLGGAGGNGDENGGNGMYEANYNVSWFSGSKSAESAGGGGGGGTDIRVGANTHASTVVTAGGGGGDFNCLYEVCDGYTASFMASFLLNASQYSCGAISAGNLAGQNGGNGEAQTSSNSDDGNGGGTGAPGAATTGVNYTTTCGNCYAGGSCVPSSGGACSGGTSSAGSSGNGGNASYAGIVPNPNTGCLYNAGGGGGGGYFGGGGGAGGGGGGGSSYTGGLASVTSVTASGNSGNGYIIIVW